MSRTKFEESKNEATEGLRRSLNPQEPRLRAARVHNAQQLVAANVDLVIFFETRESIGHAVADLFFQARIPFITVESGIESGVYYGANSIRLERWLGRLWAASRRNNGMAGSIMRC